MARTVLDLIGNTSLLPLQHIKPPNGAQILLKIESENPTGSMKDRMALAMIEDAEARGKLAPGAPVVEYTGGSTGVSLALVCAVKKHPLFLVSSDAFSKEKLDHMRCLGATVILVPSDNGRQTEKLTRDMIARAHALATEKGAYITAQMENTSQLGAYTALADEVWVQTGGEVAAFVQSVGTAASFRGTTTRLCELSGSSDSADSNQKVRCVAVEPAESAVLSGLPSGAHGIDGVGAGYVTPMWVDGLADAVERVSTEEARDMALRLARQEGLFCGTSTGANVVAAMRVAAELGEGAKVVTIMCDTGMKYLSKFGKVSVD